MSYQELEILVGSEGDGVVANVVRAPCGEKLSGPFVSPLDAGTCSALALAATGRETSAPPPDPELVGAALYTALFSGELEGLHSRSLARARKDASGLRLRLTFRLDDERFEEIFALPWELLRAPAGDFLASDVATPVVRRLLAPEPRPLLAVDPPLRVLLMAVPRPPNEEHHAEERADFETFKSAAATRLAPLVDRSLVELLEPPDLDLPSLRDALKDEAIHVLLFLGHGGFDAELGLGAIYLRDGEERRDDVSGEMLGSFLKSLPELRLVILNSCDSGRAGVSVHPHRGVATAAAERAAMPAVIANRCRIRRDSAIRLAHRLLERLVQGDPVDAALGEARLELSRTTKLEWATPLLLLAAESGEIFRIAKRYPSARPVSPVGTEPVLTLPERPPEPPLRLGVRSLSGLGEDMEGDVDRLLDLRDRFDPESWQGRRIREDSWWHEKVYPELREFLSRARSDRRALHLDFAAHTTIAFAAGYVLESKSGLHVSIRQRTAGRPLDWFPDDGHVPAGDGPLWRDRFDHELEAGSGNRALAVAIANPDLADEVQAFVERTGLQVGRLLELEVAPEAGPRSVRGGEHALRLAQAAVARVRARRPHERTGALHLFLSAPNAFSFYLGQLARSLGRVALYEYPFGHAEAHGRYLRSLTLPPPEEESSLADW